MIGTNESPINPGRFNTKELKPSNKSLLFKLIANQLSRLSVASDLSFIIFNQDLHIERTLDKFDDYRTYDDYGWFLEFPNCYRIDCEEYTSATSKSVPSFKNRGENVVGPSVLKLHGSLNWYSTRATSNISRKALFNPKRRIRITTRQQLSRRMTYTGANKRRYQAFPIIVPPVLHKASIIHEKVQPIWVAAEQALTDATDIVIYGYSCPPTDIEMCKHDSESYHKQSRSCFLFDH